MADTCFWSLLYKDGLFLRPVFVSLLASRGGHVVFLITIQRRSCHQTCLCIVSGSTWWTRDISFVFSLAPTQLRHYCFLHYSPTSVRALASYTNPFSPDFRVLFGGHVRCAVWAVGCSEVWFRVSSAAVSSGLRQCSTKFR